VINASLLRRFSGPEIVVQGFVVAVRRPCTRFIGVDLGGARGKTTAIAELRLAPDQPDRVEVVEVATRLASGPASGAVSNAKQAWTDETLIQRLAALTGDDTVIAIDAPLTQTACARCEVPVCPGMEACVDPAVVWLRTEGRSLVKVAVETASGDSHPRVYRPLAQARLAPYAHRATDVLMTYGRGLLPTSALGAANGVVAARAHQLRRRLRGAGFELHENLLEISPAATVAALCGARAARGYKRDADPWRTRAVILERLADLAFSPRSRMAREDVLGNDHCFDAVIGAYTAYLWARDGWSAPEGCFADDGWIFAPPG
jgi:predicted nuclease with RNAse H fold